jgi:ADP-ribose pyrophosphatase YjhB (NUDIX family)
MRDGKILLHKRNGGSFHGLWAFPGGHLENGESFIQGSLRELEEEAGPIQKQQLQNSGLRLIQFLETKNITSLLS